MKKDRQYWLRLSERYFEAETTEEEERELRRFAAQTSDPDFRELQAVMGFTTIARSSKSLKSLKSSKGLKSLKGSKVQQQAPLKPLKPLKLNSHYMGLAASVIVVLGLSLFFSLSNRQQDTGCVAWVNGEKITDPTEVMALMQNTMLEMNIEGSDPVEDQLRDMFELLQTPQTPQTL